MEELSKEDEMSEYMYSGFKKDKRNRYKQTSEKNSEPIVRDIFGEADRG